MWNKILNLNNRISEREECCWVSEMTGTRARVCWQSPVFASPCVMVSLPLTTEQLLPHEGSLAADGALGSEGAIPTTGGGLAFTLWLLGWIEENTQVTKNHSS